PFNELVLQLQLRAARAADAAQTWAELMERGRQLEQELRNPAEVYTDTLADLQNMLMQGAIDWDTYARGVGRAADQLERAGGAEPPTGPHALAAGSREAIALINWTRREDTAGSREDRVRQAIDTQTQV